MAVERWCYNCWMTGRLLWVNAVALLVYMSLGWLVARRANRLDVVDTGWGLGFIVVAWLVVIQRHLEADYVVAILVTIWGLRLARHTYRRSRKRGEDDPRYVALASKWRGNYWLSAYYKIFITQGVFLWVISLPIVFAAGASRPSSSWFLAAGAIIWAIGFALEAISDKQLGEFLSQPANKGQVMDHGLWRFSRHPNFFGELTQWWGIGVIACGARLGYIGLIGPLALTISIVFISGIPPIENRKRSNPAYKKYMQRTSPLIPLPRR